MLYKPLLSSNQTQSIPNTAKLNTLILQMMIFQKHMLSMSYKSTYGEIVR